MLPRGLDSVTVAPGNTAPDASVMVPPIAPTPCAHTCGVAHAHNVNTTKILTRRGAVIVIPSCQDGFVGTVRLSESIHPQCPSGRRFAVVRRANRVYHSTPQRTGLHHETTNIPHRVHHGGGRHDGRQSAPRRIHAARSPKKDGSSIVVDPSPLFELSPYLYMQFME